MQCVLLTLIFTTLNIAPQHIRPNQVVITLCIINVSGFFRQSELFDLRQQTAEWTPPPAVLHEDDLRRAEEEAAAAVKLMRAGDDKVHASRLLNLNETLTTIREGGAARLKADKDAAAVGSRACACYGSPTHTHLALFVQNHYLANGL